MKRLIGLLVVLMVLSGIAIGGCNAHVKSDAGPVNVHMK